MSSGLEIKLPDEVMERMPSNRAEVVAYLSKYADEVIHQYDVGFQRRVQGVMAGPLSRYEKALLKDFILDMTLGKELRQQLEEETQTRAFSEAVP